MNMRQTHDPYGGDTPLVDKMIGNAYSVVRFVAINMCYIKDLAAKLTNPNTVLPVVVTGRAPAVGTSVNIPITVPLTSIVSGSMVLTDAYGDVFIPDGVNLKLSFSGSNAVVTLGPSAPLAYSGAVVKIMISYNVGEPAQNA